MLRIWVYRASPWSSAALAWKTSAIATPNREIGTTAAGLDTDGESSSHQLLALAVPIHHHHPRPSGHIYTRRTLSMHPPLAPSLPRSQASRQLS
ncbi:hypothetical protein C8F01DRAFT_1158172 [Mycena amicta]|nr:hypothetical protein C8F01DRAFT_1158172 [Mycena amicta]